MAYNRLSNDEVRRRFEKYGYRLNPNFRHKNVRTKYRVYDEMNDREDDLSYEHRGSEEL